MRIFNEFQGPLPVLRIGHTKLIISVKLKLIRRVVTLVECHMLTDGQTDGRHAPYHNTTDFHRAHKTMKPDVFHN